MFTHTHTQTYTNAVLEISLQSKDQLKQCLKIAELQLSERGFGTVVLDEGKYALKTSNGTVANIEGSVKTLQNYEFWLSPPFRGVRSSDS